MNYLRSSSHYMWSTTDVLGKGATGSVFKGVHKKTGDYVAVKAFNHTSHLRPLEVQMREFEVMKKLTHENIVKMVSIEEELESQKKVLVMELCDAGSLLTILDDPENSYGLEEEEFHRVLKDLSAGMKYLRDNNIIHRDLKPGNIMKFISEDGRSIYKLTDFGAARELDDDQQFMSLYGTEEYLHPDMYERAVLRHPANKPFKATVDLWSIGVTLYHVATGSLPFRPFGGRKNRETMHYITTTKAYGVISGVQHSEKGPIEWSKELPKTSLLGQGLRDLVTVLLAGILECNADKMWSFENFFECATDIISRRIFHVFYVNEGKEVCLYMQPNKTLQDLKEQITIQTKVPAANQLLLFNKAELSSLVHPTTEITSFPSTTPNQPIILVHTDNTNVKDLTQLSALSACFPNFPPSVSLDHDAALAKTCCSVAHAVKRVVVKLVRGREILLGTPDTLLSLAVDNVTKLCSNYDILKHKTEDTYHRCDQLERNATLTSEFVALWSSKYDCSNELQQLSHLIAENKQLKEHLKQKVVPLQSAIHMLKQKVLVSMRLQTKWEQASSECNNLTGCVETADTYVRTIRTSWQTFVRDKGSRGLSLHDEQFHILGKLKVQHTSKKLENLLQEQCLKSCLQASNKLDEWYSGMQAIMVQCRLLKEDLLSVNTLVKNYSSTLQENCMAGLNFADNDEALNFKSAVQKKLQMRDERKRERKKAQQTVVQPSNAGIVAARAKSQSTQSLANGRDERSYKRKKEKLTKGTPSNFTHLQHVGWHPEKGFYVESVDKYLEDFLNLAGVSDYDLKDCDTRNFIYDFIANHGGVELAKQETKLYMALGALAVGQPCFRRTSQCSRTMTNVPPPPMMSSVPPPPPPPVVGGPAGKMPPLPSKPQSQPPPPMDNRSALLDQIK